MVLTKSIPVGTGTSTWFDYVKNQTSSVNLDHGLSCGTLGRALTVVGIFGEAPIFLGSEAVFDSPLIARASTIIHEARHSDGGLNADHCSENESVPSHVHCVCSGSTRSCDQTWSTSSSNTRQILFIEQVLANSHTFAIHPFNEHTALLHANSLIDGRFHIHPGFNLVEGPSSFVGHRVPWTFTTSSTQVEAALFGDNYFDHATTVLQSVGLSIRPETIESLHGCASYRKYEKTWSGSHRDVAGAMSVPTLSLDPQNPGPERGCETRRLLPENVAETLSVLPPPQETSAQLGIGRLRARTDGAGNLVELMVRYQPIDRGALLLTANDMQVISKTKPGFGSGPMDIDIIPPEGHFLTSLALGVSNGRINAAAAKWSLGPELEERAGGNGGASIGVAACPARWVPIGIVAKSAPSPYGSPTVGFFGLICAHGDWLRGIDSGARAEARTSFLDTTVTPSIQYPALTSIGQVAGPTGTTTVLCDLGSTMRGLRVRAGLEVDHIEAIYCNSISMPGTEKTVGIGGTGGGTTVEQNCWTSPGPTRQHNGADRLQYEFSPYFYYRSAWRLDSIAMGCYAALDDIEGFEDVRSDGLVPSPPGDLSLSIPVVNGSWVDASNNQVKMLGYGTGVTGTAVPWHNHGGASNSNNIPFAAAGTRYLVARAADGTRGTPRVIERSGVDLRHVPHGGTASLSFKYYRYGSQYIGTVEVWARARETPLPSWTMMWSDGPGSPNNTGGLVRAWQDANIDLGSLLGQVIDIQIRSIQGRMALDVGIDSIQLSTQW